MFRSERTVTGSSLLALASTMEYKIFQNQETSKIRSICR